MGVIKKKIVYIRNTIRYTRKKKYRFGWMHMKLEGWYEHDGDEHFFCWSCGAQLENIDDISQRICHKCKQSMKALKEDKTFFCWACGKELLGMGEVAQGLCHTCKASIIRKIHTPQKKRVSVDLQQ